MNKLGEKSLKTLEYYEILEKLAGQAASQAAKEKCRALRPLDDHEQAELWLQQTTDAKDLMVRQGSPAFGHESVIWLSVSVFSPFAAEDGERTVHVAALGDLG